MKSTRTGLACTIALLVTVLSVGSTHANDENNWPGLGGPSGNRISTETDLPIEWGPEKNVAWKTPIPGRGYSSPVIWGDRIFVTTAIKGDEVPGHEVAQHILGGGPWVHPDSVDGTFVHQYRVVALDVNGGDILWDELAHEGLPYDDRHKNSSYAAPTTATDGEFVYAYFGTPGLFAYDFDGNLQWSAKIGNVPTLGMGVGSSPVLAGDLVIIQADEDAGDNSALVAFDKRTGEEAWRVARPTSVTWTTPTLVQGDDRNELVTIANEWLISYDPATGEELWRMQGLEANAIHRPLLHDDTVIATAGYPQKVTKAVRLGGSGDLTDTDYLEWSYNKGTAYIPSNLVYDGYVYLLNDQGVLTCLDAETGKIVYEGGRMPVSQRFSASPVAFDGKFMMSGMDGEVFVVQAGPNFEILATNALGEGIWATPSIANGRIYIRTLDHLWAIEKMD